MGIKETMKEIRATARLKQLTGFKEIKHVEIPEIPKERTLFPGTKNDWWYAVNLPLLNITACIYELDIDSTFLPHIHDVNSEQIFILTPEAKIEVITNKDIELVSYPESVFFKPKEPHAVINKSKTVCVFMVIWSPKMNGWQGSFLPNYEVNTTSAP